MSFTAVRTNLVPNYHSFLKRVTVFFSVMKRPEREADLSPASGEELKNGGELYVLVSKCLLYVTLDSTERQINLTLAKKGADSTC